MNFGNISTVLQGIATGLTTGTIATAIATIAFFAAGVMIIFGHRHLDTLARPIFGALIIGSAATLAATVLGGG